MEIISVLVRYLLLYGILLGGSLFIADKTKKKIEYCIAPNIAIIILILYGFGICDLLVYGVWAVGIISLSLGGYTLVKNRKNLKEKIATPGFAFFTILFCVLLITTYQKNLVDYDHYLYRSLTTKIMYYTDGMNQGFPSLYPPAINLLEYFFMKVTGAYIQGMEAFAVQLLGFSLLIPLFDRVKNTKFINTIITIVILCIPAIFGNLIFYKSAYPDAILGLLIGYSLYVLYTEKQNGFKTFSVALALSVMTLLKPAGFYISAIVIGMYFLIQLQKRNWKQKEGRKAFLKSKELKTIMILTLTIIVVLATWKIFTKINNQYNAGVVRGEQSRVGNTAEYLLKNIMTTVFGYYEENHDSADSNEDLLPKLYSINAVTTPTKIPLYAAMVLITLMGILSYRYVVTQEDKKEFGRAMIALTVGLVVYILFLQASYLLKFTTKEMLGHNGLDRYTPTFLLGMIYFIVAVVLDQMEKKKDRKVNYIILVAIILLFTPLQSIADSTITSGIYNIQSIEYCNNGRIPAMIIDEAIEEKAGMISISQDTKTNLYSLMLRYYLYPNHTVYPYEQVEEKQIQYIKRTILEKQVKYLFVCSTDETLNELINTEFKNETILKENTLYQIQKEENKIELKEIPLD